MLEGNATLVIDFGNSSTKCVCRFGKDRNKIPFRRRFDLSNTFAQVETGYTVPSDYSPNTSTLIKVDTELGDRPVVGEYANGMLQVNEFPLAAIKPSATLKKYDSIATVLSVRQAFLHAYREIMVNMGITDIEQLKLTWKVVALLPPGDLENGKEPMKKIIENVDSIHSLFPRRDIEINISDVMVLPEGLCAYIAVTHETSDTFRVGYEDLMSASVMVFDIGAGTTDCLLIKNNALVQNSKHTINTGGNNVMQKVRGKLNLKGIDIDMTEIKEGMLTGVVRDGSKPIGIVKLINNAKREVAQQIINDFQEYLEKTGIKTRSVGYVLICGGGSMDSEENDEIETLGFHVGDNFKLYAPNCITVELPVVTETVTEEDGTIQKKTYQLSPRDLNLIGAEMVADVR